MTDMRLQAATCALALLVGCSFDVSGLPAPANAHDATSAAPADAHPLPPDAAPPRPDAVIALPDAPPALADAAPGDAGDPSGELTAPWTDVPPTLDGNLDDWSGATFTNFSIADAAITGAEAPGYQPSAAVRFAAEHDADYLYFGYQVTDDLLVNNSAELYEDDSISLYIDAGGDLSGTYGADDHEIVFRFDGMWQDYGNTGFPSDGLDGAVRITSDGYIVEMRIRDSALSTAPLPHQIGFDIAITDDDNIGDPNADAYGLWYAGTPMCPSCCPGYSQAEAWCDTSLFATLTLSPGN